MVAYLGEKRARRTHKEAKDTEKHFIIAGRSVPPNNSSYSVKY